MRVIATDIAFSQRRLRFDFARRRIPISPECPGIFLAALSCGHVAGGDCRSALVKRWIVKRRERSEDRELEGVRRPTRSRVRTPHAPRVPRTVVLAISSITSPSSRPASAWHVIVSGNAMAPPAPCPTAFRLTQRPISRSNADSDRSVIRAAQKTSIRTELYQRTPSSLFGELSR
jgi:hypothetical protein